MLELSFTLWSFTVV